MRSERDPHAMTRVVRGVRLRAAFVAPDVDADVLDASSDLARRFRRRRDATRDARSSTPSRASSSTDADARAIATARERSRRARRRRDRYREAAIATTRVECACDRATAALAVDLRIDPTRVGDFARGLEEMARMGFADDDGDVRGRAGEVRHGRRARGGDRCSRRGDARAVDGRRATSDSIHSFIHSS